MTMEIFEHYKLVTLTLGGNSYTRVSKKSQYSKNRVSLSTVGYDESLRQTTFVVKILLYTGA